MPPCSAGAFTLTKIQKRLRLAIDTLDNATTSPEAAVESILTDALLVAAGKDCPRRAVGRMIRNGAALQSSVARVRAEVVAAEASLRRQRAE